MKWQTRILAALLTLGVSLSAFADAGTMQTIAAAATRNTDLSRQLLTMVYGDVVSNPLHPTGVSLVGKLFFVFNSVIATLAFVWFCAVTGRQLVRAGHRGAVFSAGHTMMAPITTLAGFISMIPTASGWSLAQLLFLWAASIMGVGSANILTDKIADLVLSGQSMIVQPVAPQTLSTARAIFEMNLCRAGINTELAQMYQRSGTGGTAMMAIRPMPQGFDIGNGSAFCGSARLPQGNDDTGQAGNFLFRVPVDVSGIRLAQQNALNQMQNQLADDADSFVNAITTLQNTDTGTIPDAESRIQAAASQYEDMLNQAARAQNPDNQLQSVMSEQLKSQGWLALGAWYQTLATANNKISDAVKMQPVVTGPSQLGEVGVKDFYTEVDTAYRAQRQNTTYTAPLGTLTSRDTRQTADTSTPGGVMSGIFATPTLQLTNRIATLGIGSASGSGGQINPLIQMKTIGDYTLGSTEAAFGLFVAARAAQGWVSGGNLWATSANAITGEGDAARGAMEALSPLVYAVLGFLFVAGFSLSIYLPMIPLIFWVSAATTWLVGVLVGTTAGGLWGATHIGTEEDKGSRSAYGYIFLIDVMTRPPLMVFGFVFAGLIIVAVGTLLNALFGPGIVSVQSASVTGIVSMVGFLMVYSRMCTTLVSRAFSLVVTMPDYVISWLGGREGINMLSGMSDSIGGMINQAGRGISQLPSRFIRGGSGGAHRGIPGNRPGPEPEEDGIK